MELQRLFIALLTDIVSASNDTKCVSSSDHKYLNQSTLIKLHPNEYSQELDCHPFLVNWRSCVQSWNVNDLSNEVCISNKAEDLNLDVFNMNKIINESNGLKKHLSCKCKCKFYGKNCSLDQWYNNVKCGCECRKPHVCEKNHILNPATCSCKNGKYLVSIIDDWVNTYDEIMEPCDEEILNYSNKFHWKKVTCKTQKFYILLHSSQLLEDYW